jgi:hypothetical protein
MNHSGVTFEGSGPFHLPAAQRATATGHENKGVTMTVYCLLPKREKGVLVYRGMGPEAVSIQMLSWVARELGTQLLRAAKDSERERR